MRPLHFAPLLFCFVAFAGCSRIYSGAARASDASTNGSGDGDSPTIDGGLDGAVEPFTPEDAAQRDALPACTFPAAPQLAQVCDTCARASCCQPAAQCFGEADCSAFVVCYMECRTADASLDPQGDDPCIDACSSNARTISRAFGWFQCLREACGTKCP